MTKKTIITTLFLIFYVFANAQADVEKNLKKYWYYRDRLEKEYMIVGSPEKPGTNWPFMGKNSWNMKVINYGENPTQDFGTYLGVLATEYRLLKDYKQNAKANETLQKLAWALESFDRTDLNCEKFFRYRLESGLTDYEANFWDYIDDYKYSSDLNGCFLRGDADGPEVYINDNGSIYEGFKYGRDSVGSYPSNPAANILTYNNNQLPNNNCGGLRQVGSRINSPHYEDDVPSSERYRIIKANNRTVMSQDEVWGLFMGLAFIVKFVDDNKKFTDLEDNQVTINEWAKKITARVIRFMKSNYTPILGDYYWQLTIPVGIHGQQIWENDGGIIWDMFAFAEAANKICGRFYDGNGVDGFHDWRSLSPIIVRYSAAVLEYHAMKQQLLDRSSPGIKGKPYGKLNLALIADRKTFSYYYRLYKKCSEELGVTAFERLPVVYSLLHSEVPLSANMSSDNYKDYKNDYLSVLNKAKYCGPWTIAENNVTQAFSSREWSLNNRWEDDLPDQRLIHEMDYGTGQGNGLSYMILHNLYWLGFLDENMNNYEESVVVNHDYPWWWYGTDSNPKVITGKTITSDKVVESNGNLTLIASESVTLNEGFDAKQGSNFDAYLKPYYHYISYDPGCPCFFERPEFDKNYVSKDTVINTGKNSRIVTENKTEEKNKDISSIENDKLTEKVIISPNPFNNQLFIYSTGKINKNTSVQIYNNLGVLVFEDYNINSFKTINTYEFSAGLYIVKIKTQDKILTYKIIKQ